MHTIHLHIVHLHVFCSIHAYRTGRHFHVLHIIHLHILHIMTTMIFLYAATCNFRIHNCIHIHSLIAHLHTHIFHITIHFHHIIHHLHAFKIFQLRQKRCRHFHTAAQP